MATRPAVQPAPDKKVKMLDGAEEKASEAKLEARSDEVQKSPIGSAEERTKEREALSKGEGDKAPQLQLSKSEVQHPPRPWRLHSAECGLYPVADFEASMSKCVKRAMQTLSGSNLEAVLKLDPASPLEDRVIQLGMALNDDRQNTTKLFFRPCYSACMDYILPLIEQNASILVGGAPGIGKSVFGLFLATTLVHIRHKVVLYDHYGVHLLLATADSDAHDLEDVRKAMYILGFEADQLDLRQGSVFKVVNKSLFEVLREMQKVVFIQDADDSLTEIIPFSGKPFVLITSPNTERIKRPTREGTLKQIFLPPWSLEELQTAAIACFEGKFKKDKVEKQFQKFGGIPRSVLDIRDSIAQEKADDAYDDAVNGCTLDSLSETFRASYENVRRGPISAMLVHAVPMEPGVGGISSMSKNQFASKFTKFAIIERFIRMSPLKTAELIRAVNEIPELAECVRRFLEARVHRFFLMGDYFRIRSLSCVDTTFSTVLFPGLSEVLFSRDDFMDISNVLPSHYYMPSRSNFPSFALLPAAQFFHVEANGFVLVLFQLAKTRSNTLSGVIVKRLQDRLAALGVAFRNTLFVWVSRESGITSEQTVTDGDGKKYVKDEPRMEQWLLLAFGKEFDDLFMHI